MSLPATPITTQIIPTSTAIYYCDPGDIQRRLSIEGVKLHTQDYGKNASPGEAGAVEEAIWDATEIINYYCYTHYDPGSLVNSLWVNRRCTDIACYLLCQRRGNAASGSLTERYKQAIDWLEKIHSSVFEIPNVPFRHTVAPAFSNVSIDQRFGAFRLRVEEPLSDRTSRPYAYLTDWSTVFDYYF